MPKVRTWTDEAPVLLAKHLSELGFRYDREYRFDKDRKWRFDFVIWPNVAIEIEGGIWSQGRHTRGKGYLGDLEKYREAAARGWRVYRFSTQEVLNGTAREFICKHCL